MPIVEIQPGESVIIKRTLYGEKKAPFKQVLKAVAGYVPAPSREVSPLPGQEQLKLTDRKSLVRPSLHHIFHSVVLIEENDISLRRPWPNIVAALGDILPRNDANPVYESITPVEIHVIQEQLPI